MTLGELADMLEELSKAERDVADWQHALDRDISDDTRSRRLAALADAEDFVARLRDQEIGL